MKDKKLTIIINKPTSEVFEFTTNPKNTALWVDSIVHEETNEWPVKKGTLYRNRNKAGDWSEYELTSYEENKSFVMSMKNGSYHVRYILTPLYDQSCELEYYEWVDEGDLAEPFTMEILEKLKSIIEK